ncbi:hypothetical protein OUZ56_015364 [Daphnia magna]|uniref:Uncharacterized protein n=1 Tax=Daphnia magna TaxID=35525 RepID=A0ABR0AML3_9CRUS|nr:hypothetical protein OUZ56_015364 [Daphnia magna]
MHIQASLLHSTLCTASYYGKKCGPEFDTHRYNVDRVLSPFIRYRSFRQQRPPPPSSSLPGRSIIRCAIVVVSLHPPLSVDYATSGHPGGGVEGVGGRRTREISAHSAQRTG